MSDAVKASRAINKISRAFKSKNHRGKRTGRGKLVKPPAVKPQKCIVKTAYSKNTGTGNWQAHGKYLEREGAQSENEIGKGFGSDGENVEISKTLAKWEQAKDPHMFKFIISPEFGEKIDMQAYCKELVAQMEKDLDTKLQWVAVDHNNTDNPHVHLIIRGIDQEKQPLLIDQQYIKEGCRNRAIGILNRELGPRDMFYEKEAYDRQITQKRFTALDRQIKKSAKDNTYSMNDTDLKKWQRTKQEQEHRMQIIRRLKQLEQMGLATRVGNLSWQVDPELDKKLREIAINENRQKIMESKRKYFSNENAEITQTQLKQPGDKVMGKLVGAGLDPETDLPYVLIEGIDGKAHFVYQNKAIERERSKDLKVGDMVAVQVNEFEKNGKKIKFAKVENFGQMNDAIKNDSFVKECMLDLINKNEYQKAYVAGLNESIRKSVDKVVDVMVEQGLAKKENGNVEFVNKEFEFNNEKVKVLSYNNKETVKGKIVEFDHLNDKYNYTIVRTDKGLVAVNNDFADKGIFKSKIDVDIKLENQKFVIRKTKQQERER